jgi:hypothetical protein
VIAIAFIAGVLLGCLATLAAIAFMKGRAGPRVVEREVADQLALRLKQECDNAEKAISAKIKQKAKGRGKK